MDILIHSSQDVVIPLTMFFTVFSLSIIAFGLLMGAWRGVHRSFIRIGTLLISAVAAYLLALPSEKVPLDALHYAIANAGLEIIQSTPALEHLLDGYVLALAAPFVFLVLFIVFSIVSYLLYLILAFAIFPRKKYKPRDGSKGLSRHRLFGLLVGGLASVLVVACVNLPFYGFSHFVTEDIGDVLVGVEDTVEFKDTHGVSEVISEHTFGFKLFNKLTTADMYGYHISLHEDGKDIVSTAIHAIHALKTPMKDWDDHAKNDADSVFESIKTSKALSTVLSLEAEVLRDALITEEGIEGVEIPDSFKSVVVDLLEKLSHNDTEEYGQIIDATRDVFFVFLEGMQRNSVNNVSAELILGDEKMLSDILDAVLPVPAFDTVTVSALDMGIAEMVKQLGLKGEYKTDAASWARATTEERKAEAKFLAEIIPQIIEVEKNENGEAEWKLTGATNVAKLNNSLLVGSATKQIVRSLAANLLMSLKDSEKTDTPTVTDPAEGTEGESGNESSAPQLPDDIIDATEGKTQDEVIESIPDMIVDGGLSQEVVDALPDIVKDVELDEESVNTLQEVVDELSGDQELVDAIPDYLKDFLDKNGIVIGGNENGVEIPDGVEIPEGFEIPGMN